MLRIAALFIFICLSFLDVKALDTKECVSKFWYASIYDETINDCSCRSTYILWKDYKWNNSCITQSQVCKNEYWIMWIYNNSNKSCWCYSWYLLVNNQCQYWWSVCNSKIWYGSFYNTNIEKCECKEGFELINWKCTSFSQKCVNEIWYGSFYDNNKSICKCNTWYTLINWKCKSWKSHCLITLWTNSLFDNQSNNCKCIPWYQLVNNKCVSDSNKCINDIGYGSFYDSESSGCLCKVWYKLRNWKCVSNNYYCAGTLWNWSVYKSDIDQCTCKEGYIINNWKCKQWHVFCRNILWIYSTYNKGKSICWCVEWHELIDNQCINKNKECSYKLWTWWVYDSIKQECWCKIWYNFINDKCVSESIKCREEIGWYSYFNTKIMACTCSKWTNMFEWKCTRQININITKHQLFKNKHEDEILELGNKLRKWLYAKFDKKSIDKLREIAKTVRNISLNYVEKNNVNLKSKSSKLVVLITFNDLVVEYLSRNNYDEEFRSNKKKKIQEERKVEEAFEIKNDSNNNVSIRKQADDYFKNNNFNEAIILYEKLLSNGVYDLVLINNIFISYIHENKFIEANKILFFMYNIIDEKDLVTGFTIIEWNLSQKIYDKSIEYRNIDNKDDVNIAIEYAELLYKAWDYYYEDDKVKNYLAIMSTYTTAYVILDKTLLNEPSNDKILFLQWKLLMDINGNFNLAQSKLEKAIEINQDDFNYYYRLWNTLSHQEKHKEAKEQYIKWIELEKKYEKLYLNLWNRYFDLNEDEKWFLTYQKGINICKTHCDWFYHNMGNEYYHNNDYVNARIWYKKVSENHPSYETDNNIIELIKDK